MNISIGQIWRNKRDPKIKFTIEEFAHGEDVLSASGWMGEVKSSSDDGRLMICSCEHLESEYYLESQIG